MFIRHKRNQRNKLNAELVHRIMAMSCRSQGDFTVRFGHMVFKYGLKYVEFELNPRTKWPFAKVIPAESSDPGIDIARVVIPPWMAESNHYALLETFIFKLVGVPCAQEDNYLPIVSLPVLLYKEFLEHGSLRLDEDFHPVRRKGSAFYEIRKEGRDYLFEVLLRRKPVKSFVVHLEPRIPRGKRE